MTHKERFFNTVERKPVDYPASWLGMPTDAAIEGLLKHFNAKDILEVKQKINDDLYVVNIPYESPVSSHIAFPFDWAGQGYQKPEEQNLTLDGYFVDKTDLADIDKFPWPNPADFIDPAECKRVVDEVPDDYPVMVASWSMNYEATSAAFGMEQALITMMMNPEMFTGVMDKIVDFYLKANKIFYEAAGDKLDIVLIGNDLGTQRGLLLSPDHIREFVLPGAKKLIDQAHSYGLKVLYHSCGSIHEIIPDLIEVGVDIVHPIQALAANMEPEGLQKDFHDKVTFCGGVDAQNLLVSGTVEEVKSKVKELKGLFPTGLIVSPSHEAILPDMNPANIEALFTAVKE